MVLTACAEGGAAPTVPGPVRAGAPVALDAVPYTVVGPRTLMVVVPVGGCRRSGSPDVEVAETATSVTVRASVRPAADSTADAPPDAPCAVGLRTLPVTVELAAPLGARTVVDGVGGRIVPPGAWPGLT